MVCAVEDPGVPNPLKQLTILGQNLRQVAENLTDLLENIFADFMVILNFSQFFKEFLGIFLIFFIG